MANWGVPDWWEADRYPRVESATTREWWWEFTRRRPDYRALWDGVGEVEGEPYRYAPDVDDFRLRFQLSVIHDPAVSLSDWSLMDYRYPTNYARSHRDLLAEQWDNPFAEYGAASAEHRGKLTHERGHRLYNFDLTQPLGPQFERAERYLKAVQEELYGKAATRRPRQANWRNFLRVIDGRDCGASFATIAAGLWPGQEKTPQSARDTYVAACELRDNFPI